jgi:hypothetical protein
MLSFDQRFCQVKPALTHDSSYIWVGSLLQTIIASYTMNVSWDKLTILFLLLVPLLVNYLGEAVFPSAFLGSL